MPGLSPKELARKADEVMTYAGLSAAGQLNDKQLTQFRAIMIAESRLWGDCEVVLLDQKKMKYEYAGFTGPILFPVAEESAFPAELEKGLSMIKIPFDCQKFGAAVPITDEVLRNNLNQNTLVSFMMSQALPQIALNTEDYAINSDKTGGATYYDAIDGLLSRPTSHVLTPGTAQAVGPRLWDDMLISMPSKYRRDKPNMRFYCSPNTEQAYIYERQSKTAAPGYDYAEQDKGFRTSYSGIPIFPLEGIPDGYSILTHRKNIVGAFEKKAEAEPKRQAEYPRTMYYFWCWFDVNYAVEDAVVLHTNIEITVAPTV